MAWLFGSLLGALVVALPDDDTRVLSLSASHGPSAVDLLGIAILMAAWLPILLLLWSARATIRGTWAAASALLAGTGALILLVAIPADLGGAWVAGAALLVAAQLLAVAAIGTAPARP